MIADPSPHHNPSIRAGARRMRPTLALLSLLVISAMLLSACGASGGGAASGPTQVPANVLQISFLYGSEKQAWIEAVTKTFNDSQTKTASGKSIFVQTKPLGSGESMTNILTGADQPTMWSPASRVWIPLLNDEWSQKNGKDLISEQCKDAVLSPVVVMMWKPMAEALGWPTKDIGWSDIAKLSTSTNGWADVGKPQFGKFRFGHTHPDFSNSGLQTIVAMTYAATGKQRGLTVDDVKAPTTAKFINDLESSVAHYGSSTGFFGDNMIARGTSYLSASVVYESVVISSYSKTPEFPLVAIYPKEGTFQSDHPLCIPDAPWINADQKEAAGIYRDFLLSKPVQQQALQFGFRPANTEIPIAAPIDLDHGADPKQPQNVLAVPDAKTIRAIRDLWKAQKRQVNLTLLIDISGSMRDQNKMQGAREGAAAFIDQLDASDNLTIIVFDDKQDILFDNQNVGQNRDAMKKEVGSLVPRGGTALYDSIALAIKRMKIDPKRINALVVMTDGQDTNSTQYRSVNALTTALGAPAEGQDAEVSVFTIGYGADADERTLKSIADKAKGAYRKGSTADILAVFREISTFF